MTINPSPLCVRVGEAAHIIGVTANTLRSWERRHGLTPSVVTDGGQRRYQLDLVCGLRDAVAEGYSGLSAVRRGEELAAGSDRYHEPVVHERLDQLAVELRSVRGSLGELGRMVATLNGLVRQRNGGV
jgi:hypothetical protein